MAEGVLFILLGYFSGAIPFGYLLGKLKGVDIRKYGSGNIGFTNVKRTLGLGLAIPVFILDCLKGLLPTLYASRITDDTLLSIVVGLATIFGSIFSPFLGFRGGKGVATTIGVFLALFPKTILVGIVVFFLVLLITSYVSLASLSFAIVLLFSNIFFFNIPFTGKIFTFVVALLIIFRHRTNIQRLLKGVEPKTPLI